jgi:PAS domain S-box-containing protein
MHTYRIEARAEARLRRKEKPFSIPWLEKNYGLALSGYHLLAEDGTILWANQAEANMLGYSPKKMIGMSFLDLIAPDQRSEAWQRFLDKLGRKSVEKKIGRTYLKSDKKTLVYVFSKDKVAIGPDGKRVVLTELIDITELRALQEEVSALRLANTIRWLAAGSANGFNTQFAAIQNSLSLLDRIHKAAGIYDYPDIRTIREIVQDCCRTGSQLIQALISYSRNVAEPFAGQVVDLAAVTREAVSLFEHAFNPQGHTLEIAGSDGTVHGNAAEINIAVLNLLLNARDAIPADRSGVIRVTLESISPQKKTRAVQGVVLAPGSYLKLSVADNGSGIPGGIREHIFTPFFTTKGSEADRGFGLSTVLGIIGRHRGGITLETREGEGSTFHLYFPSPDVLA